MALMEYCLVNIVLGDSDLPPKPTDALKPDKIFDLAAKVQLVIDTGYNAKLSTNPHSFHLVHLVLYRVFQNSLAIS